MADNINTPCKRYEAALGAWQLIDDLQSRQSMRDAGERRLPRLPAESIENWKSRVAGARLLPALQTAVETLAGRLHESGIEPAEDTPQRLIDWYWANEIQGMLDALALDGLKYGQSHLWIDADGVYQIPAKDMLEFWPLSMPHEYVRFRRNIEQPGDVIVHQIYKVTPEKILIYQSDSDSDYAVTQELENGLNFVPVLTAAYSEIPYKPYFQTLSELNEAHWQSYAFQVYSEAWARFIILVASGVNDDIKISTVSPKSMLLIPPDAKITQLEGGGAGIAAGRLDLEKLELQMAALSARPLQQDGIKSATEVNRSSATEDAPIKRMAEMQIAFVSQAIRMAGKILGVSGNWYAEGKTDFTPIQANSQDVAQLLQAFSIGLIDAETARQAMINGLGAMRGMSARDIGERVDGGAVLE